MYTFKNEGDIVMYVYTSIQSIRALGRFGGCFYKILNIHLAWFILMFLLFSRKNKLYALWITLQSFYLFHEVYFWVKIIMF